MLRSSQHSSPYRYYRVTAGCAPVYVHRKLGNGGMGMGRVHYRNQMRSACTTAVTKAPRQLHRHSVNTNPFERKRVCVLTPFRPCSDPVPLGVDDSIFFFFKSSLSLILHPHRHLQHSSWVVASIKEPHRAVKVLSQRNHSKQ